MYNERTSENDEGRGEICQGGGGSSVGVARHDEERARGTQDAGRTLRKGRHQSLMGGMALQALTVAPGHASGTVGDSLGDSLKTAQTPPYLTRCYGFTVLCRSNVSHRNFSPCLFCANIALHSSQECHRWAVTKT